MASEKFSLPSGKRIAILVSVLLETWSENKYPSYFPRTSPLGQGKVDHAAIDWSQFGGRDGIWRLNRILSQAGIRGTLFCNGRSAELFASAVKQWIAQGHRIAGHAYLQDELLAYMSAEDEKRTIKKSVAVLRDVAGTEVKGWVTPIYGWTQNTAGFLADEGIAWTSDGMHASMPEITQVNGRKLVLIPWSDFVDNRVRATPGVYYDTYKDVFDYLYSREPNSVINVGIHAHFGGRPLMSAQFAKVLDYFKRFPDVWFPTHDELAEHVLKFPEGSTAYSARFFGEEA